MDYTNRKIMITQRAHKFIVFHPTDVGVIGVLRSLRSFEVFSPCKKREYKLQEFGIGS